MSDTAIVARDEPLTGDVIDGELWQFKPGEDVFESSFIAATRQYINHPDVTNDFTELAMTALVKWDGCVDLHWYRGTDGNGGWDSDYEDHLHICDLDEFIGYLTALRAKATAHYGPEWPDV